MILDTSILIAIERDILAGKPAYFDLANRRYSIAAITVSEMLVGVRLASEPKRARRVSHFNYVMSNVKVLPFTNSVADVHANLVIATRSLGTPMGAHDLLIAATAVYHDFELMTLDTRSFPHIPGVRLAAAP